MGLQVARAPDGGAQKFEVLKNATWAICSTEQSSGKLPSQSCCRRHANGHRFTLLQADREPQGGSSLFQVGQSRAHSSNRTWDHTIVEVKTE